MEQKNEMMITFDSRSSNESFARVAVAAFTTQLNPTLEEVADIKTAVSEAITNAIIHGYDNQVKKIRIRCRVSDRTLYVEVEDDGKGIADVKKAMEPWYTTRPDLDQAPGWVLLSWKHLWIRWKWNRKQVWEQLSG